MKRRNKLPEWWDDAETWMTAADIIANVGPWLMIVMALAMVVSAL